MTENTIYKIEVDTIFLTHYPAGEYESYEISRGTHALYFPAVKREEALKSIRQIAEDGLRGELYRFRLLRLPMEQLITGNGADKIIVFDRNGKAVDATPATDADGHFLGCPAEKMRFAPGDIVEFADRDGYIKAAVVVSQPPTPEEVIEKGLSLSTSAYNYIVAYKDGRKVRTARVHSLELMTPWQYLSPEAEQAIRSWRTK